MALFVGLLAAALLAAWLARRGAGPPARVPSARPPAAAEAPVEPPAGARAAQPGPRTAAPAPGTPEGAGVPTLALRVVSAEDGAPLAGVGVELHRDDERGSAALAVSDEAGRIELPLAPERAHTLWAPRTPDHGDAELELPPAAPGARLERELALPTGMDLVWYVRVEHGGALDSGADPVEGASVVACERPSTSDHAAPAEGATDAAGLARLRCRSWWRTDARIEAPGIGVALVEVDPGHETPGEALVVRLWPTATLVAEVLDPGGAPQSGVSVAVEVWGFELGPPDEASATNAKLRVEATTDAAGRARLEGVPAALGLDLRLARGGVELLREEAAAPLAPGATEARRYVVGGVGAVRARALDPSGAPVEGVELVAVPGAPGGDHGRALERRFFAQRVAARARTGADGRAELAPLPLGRWTVGALEPAPEDASRAAELARGSVAPVLELTAAAPVAELELRLAPPLAIAGRLVDEAGAGVPDVLVRAYGQDFGCAREARSAADGAFRVGALPAGRYGLSLEPGDAPYVEPRLGDISAGIEDLVVVLRRGGGLAGAVVDAVTGALVPEVMVRAYATASDRPYVIRDQEWSHDGRFELAGLDDGPHALVAETEDGRVGLLTGLHVTRPEVRRELELRVAPGVQVRVQYAGSAPSCDVLVTRDGAKLSYVRYEPGVAESFLVPPGPLEFQVERAGAAPERFTREAVEGRPLEVLVE